MNTEGSQKGLWQRHFERIALKNQGVGIYLTRNTEPTPGPDMLLEDVRKQTRGNLKGTDFHGMMSAIETNPNTARTVFLRKNRTTWKQIHSGSFRPPHDH
jgi:hypothetical protein